MDLGARRGRRNEVAMWLMTKYGFYSIVQKEPGTYHIRARERHDLENLIELVPLKKVGLVETKLSDYHFRIIVRRDTVLAILAFLGDTLDYDNFKDCIGKTPDQAHKPYHEVWGVLAEALGAYGSPGMVRKG